MLTNPNSSSISYFLLAIFFATRLLFILYPFWGLEYEDSYIFTDSARYMSYDYDFHTMPYRCNSCLDGSYTDCYSYGTLGGHYLTFPILVHVLNVIKGYSTDNAFLVNFSVSLSIIFFVYFWNRTNITKSSISINIVLLLLSVTPFVPIFNTSGLAETLSSAFVLFSVLSLSRANDKNFNIASTEFYLSIIFIVMAIVTKRENLVLLAFLVFIPILRRLHGKSMLPKGYIILSFICSVAVSGFVIYTDLFGIEFDETGDIGASTFSLAYFIDNSYQLLQAALNFEYWGITGYLFLITLFVSIYKKNFKQLETFCLIVIAMYVGIYASHYRSYYQVIHQISHPFETLRYSTNYIPLVVVFIASVYHNRLRISTSNVLIKYGVLILIFGVLMHNTIQTRLLFSEDEFRSRIEPVYETLASMEPNDIVISTTPVIFRCFAHQTQRIVDLFQLSQRRLDEMRRLNQTSHIYLLTSTDMALDIDRYGLDIELADFKPISTINNKFIISKLP